MDVESFARVLHEAGREAVEKGATVNPTGARFLGWDEITDAAREGRRIQARYVLDRFAVDALSLGKEHRLAVREAIGSARAALNEIEERH